MPVMREFAGQMPHPRTGSNFLRQFLHNRHAWTHLRGHSQGKGRGPRSGEARAADFARACEVEMHVDACGHLTKPFFFARIFGKNASVQRAYPDLTLVFHSYRKNASVWTRCLGKKLKVEKQRVLKCMHCRRLAVTWARILQQICGQEICEGRNAHGHLTRATLCENLHYSKDAVQQQGDNHFVRA